MFASSIYDLGQTNVVSHKINTEHANRSRSIKQASRGFPIHLTQEVDAKRRKFLRRMSLNPETAPGHHYM